MPRKRLLPPVLSRAGAYTLEIFAGGDLDRWIPSSQLPSSSYCTVQYSNNFTGYCRVQFSSHTSDSGLWTPHLEKFTSRGARLVARASRAQIPAQISTGGPAIFAPGLKLARTFTPRWLEQVLTALSSTTALPVIEPVGQLPVQGMASASAHGRQQHHHQQHQQQHQQQQ